MYLKRKSKKYLHKINISGLSETMSERRRNKIVYNKNEI